MRLRIRLVALGSRRRGADHDRHIIVEAIRPGEFGERVDEDDHQADDLELPLNVGHRLAEWQGGDHRQQVFRRVEQRERAAEREERLEAKKAEPFCRPAMT